MRTGRFGKKDELYLVEHYKTQSIEDLAKNVGKTTEAVLHKLAVLGINYATKDDRKVGAFADIRNSPYWTQLKAELTGDEMNIFIEHWKEIISQFQEDILHTEKLQVMDLIKMEILMSRDLTTEKLQNEVLMSCKDRMKSIHKDKKLSVEEKEQRLTEIGMEMGMAISTQKEIRRSYNDLLKEKKTILKSMKSTREQRIGRLQDANQNFSAWLSEIQDNPVRRRKIGIEMEKRRLAAEVEVIRLSEWHQYLDGEIDQPFLTPDTVKNEND